MAWCQVAVLRAWRASGAGLAGFRRAGWAVSLRADVPEPAADAGRGQPPGGCGAFPWQAQVGGERAGQVELGVGGDDQPGPPVRGGRVTQFRAGPAEGLFQEPERVLKEQARLHA